MSDDKIIQFPTNRIVDKTKVGINSTKNAEYEKKLRDQNIKQFVESATDDLALNLLRQLYDLAVKTDKESFTKDFALVTDCLRGLIYRDFEMKHPSQIMSDKMVMLKTNKDGSQSAKINYSEFLEKKHKVHTPISKELKEELNDLNETGIKFEPDIDLDT